MKLEAGLIHRAARCLQATTLLVLLAVLAGCAGPQLTDHRAQTPVFDFQRFFSGKLTAHGIVNDRGGKVLRRFVVDMRGDWQGDVGTLDEHFRYDDGEVQHRVWTVRKQPDGSLTGTAGDVVGEAAGRSIGPAFNWQYTLALPIRGNVYGVQFDDWMYLVDDKTVLNRAYMSKFGVRIGEVTLSIAKP